MAVEGDKARVTKQKWRTVVISLAAVTFSATAGLEPPLRNLITFARAGASFSAKQLCSSVLRLEWMQTRCSRKTWPPARG